MTAAPRRLLALLSLAISLALAALCAGATTAAAAAGDLDATFDGDGIATMPFTGGGLGTSVAVQGDGKLVVGGYTGGFMGGDFALARFDADGSPDTSFSSDGRVVQNVGSSDEFSSDVAVLDDGKILQVGTVDLDLGGWFGLARYNADGSPDTGFDVDGAVTTQWSGFDFLNVHGLAVDDKGTSDTSDDQYVVVGDATDTVDSKSEILIARYNADGSLDSGFGSGGKAVIALAGDAFVADVVLQSGKVVVGGYGADGFLLARLQVDGSGLDTTFGGSNTGTVSHAVGAINTYAYDLIAQADGKLLLAGSTEDNSIAVARYSADGALDTGFHTDGIATTSFEGIDFASAYGIAEQADGKIIVSGTGYGTAHNVIVARYTTGGDLDLSFSGDGKVVTAIGEEALGEGLALDADGKAVVAGAIDPDGGDHNGDLSSGELALLRYETGDAGGGDDATAPVVNLDNPADLSYTQSRRPAITGTAGSAATDGDLTFELNWWNGSAWVNHHNWSFSKPSSGSFSTTVPLDLSDGIYHLRAYQSDAAGNDNPQDSRSSRLFEVDTAAPVVNLSSPAADSSTTSTRPAIGGTAGTETADGELTFELHRWNGSSWSHVRSWTHPKPTSGSSFSTQVPFDLTPATYYLYAFQHDAAGNLNPQDGRSGRQFTVAPLSNPAVVKITSPVHQSSTNQRQPTVSGTSDTAGQVRLELHRWTGSAWVVHGNYSANVANGYWSVKLPQLPDGQYGPIAYQTNSAGQTGSATGTWFFVDTVGPAKPRITSPGNNTKVGTQTPAFSGTADSSAGQKIYLEFQGYQNNGTWRVVKTEAIDRSGGNWSFKPSGWKFTEGSFAVFAWQYDAAGNLTYSDASYFEVDLDAKTADNPGTTNDACQKTLDYGPFHVEGSCLQRDGLTWVTSATVKVNGISLEPSGGRAKVILDPFNLRIAAQGRVKVVLGPAHLCIEDTYRIISDECFYSYTVGPFVLYEGSFDWSWQKQVSLPERPQFGVPGWGGVQLPQLPGLSGWNLPNLRIPDWGQVALPDFSKIRGPQIGSLTLPSINAPNVTLPERYFGNFKFDLPSLSIGSSGATNILGFPIEGRLGLQFKDQGVYIDAGLKLPSLLGGTVGDATLFVGNSGNLLAKNLHLGVASAPLGPIGFRDISVDFDGAHQLWSGRGIIDLPIPPDGLAVVAGAGFQNGQLVNAEAGFEKNIPIATSGLFLYGGSVYFKTVPRRIVGGTIALGLGPKINNVSAVRVDSDIQYKFAEPGWQSSFRFDGGVKVVGIRLGGAWLEIFEEGLIKFGGDFGKDFGNGFKAVAYVDGWIQGPQRRFNVYGKGEVKLGDWFEFNGEVNVSHIGVGGCAYIDSWGRQIRFGATYKWGGAFNPMWESCSISAVKAKQATARAAGAKQTVTVPGGEAAYVMGFKGRAGAPDVTLVGPNGERVSTAGQSGLVNKDFLVVHIPEQNLTQVVLHKPAAGAWTAEVADGSTPVDQVLTAESIPTPNVEAKVTGKGYDRKLEYDTSDVQSGQRVSFVEVGPEGVQHVIGAVGPGEGSVRFTPIAGPAGMRTIDAVVTDDGVTRFNLEKVASFRATKPAIPAAPGKVIAKRKKGKKADTLATTWTKVAGATEYRVTVVLNGRPYLYETKKPNFKVPGLFDRSSAAVSVAGVNALGQVGKAKKARVAAPKAKHPKKKKKKKKR